jgi:hypothetical protein
MNYYKIESYINIIVELKMIQLVAEIEQANADSPDIFDYIIEAFEMAIIRSFRVVNYVLTFRL